MSERSNDIEIGEVNTRIEVSYRASQRRPDERALADRVIQQLREERRLEAMREEDGRIRDRSWISDVKPV